AVILLSSPSASAFCSHASRSLLLVPRVGSLLASRSGCGPPAFALTVTLISICDSRPIATAAKWQPREEHIPSVVTATLHNFQILRGSVSNDAVADASPCSA